MIAAELIESNSIDSNSDSVMESNSIESNSGQSTDSNARLFLIQFYIDHNLSILTRIDLKFGALALIASLVVSYQF